MRIQPSSVLGRTGRSTARSSLGWLAVGLLLTATGGCSPGSSEQDSARQNGDGATGLGYPKSFANEDPIDPPYLTDIDPSAQPSEGSTSKTSDGSTSKPSDGGTSKPSDGGASSPAGEPSETLVADDSKTAADTKLEGPQDYRKWPTPDVALVVTGRQHGYLEPCGCTGLEKQKGGVARRFTMMRELRDRGWPLIPIDAGDQVRRLGSQANVKLQQTVKALDAMDYQAVGFGPDDLRLGAGELLSVAASEGNPDETLYVSANVALLDPSLMMQTKIVGKNGVKVGITSILDPDSIEAPISDEILIEPAVEAAQRAAATLKMNRSNFSVLLFFGTEEAAEKLVQQVPGFNLIVAAGSFGEPTYKPVEIEGSKTKMIVTGNKGMYAGLVGIYHMAPMKYARVPLSHEFEDAPEMRKLMGDYQNQLKQMGFDGLGLLPPIPHSSGQKFVGSDKCGECHTEAYEIWKDSGHALATEHIVTPTSGRGDVARHFDPECVSCHVTGWNAQEYFPYVSGYLSLEESGHLTGSGCENCHGPGSEHVAAEEDGSGISEETIAQLRESMKLPLSKAREKCMTCHDLDNSPDFHEEGAFEEVYWPQVEHHGLD